MRIVNLALIVLAAPFATSAQALPGDCATIIQAGASCFDDALDLDAQGVSVDCHAMGQDAYVDAQSSHPHIASDIGAACTMACADGLQGEPFEHIGDRLMVQFCD